VVNPEPKKTIASVHISNRTAKAKSAFLLLGITGANPAAASARTTAKLDTGEVFRLSFDGDVDALGTKGEIEAQGINPAAFDAGKFVDGWKGKAFVVAREGKEGEKVDTGGFHCAEPADFPVGPAGTISVWLQADEWRGRVKGLKADDYRRVMWPFESKRVNLRFRCEPEDGTNEKLTMEVDTPGVGGREDVTGLVKTGEWFNVTVVWAPIDGQAKKVRRVTYFNGKPLGAPKEYNAPGAGTGERITIGRPGNGGQPWFGTMDEFRVWKRALSAEEIEKIAAEK
jgi:hypothetical protein